MPPIIAQGVLLDVAAAKGVAMLPDSYPVTPEDLEATVARQGVRLARGRCRGNPDRADDRVGTTRNAS